MSDSRATKLLDVIVVPAMSSQLKNKTKTTKSLPVSLKNVLDEPTKITNFIHSQQLSLSSC